MFADGHDGKQYRNNPSKIKAYDGYGDRSAESVSRLYKDGDEWKDSTIFGRDDLPLVAKVVDQAHSYIFGCNQS